MRARDRYFVEGVFCLLDGEALRVANLGSGGFFAESDNPPSLGQTLVLELALPHRANCRVVGEVSWINGIRARRIHDLPPGFGVKLKRLEPRDREAIEEVLRHADPVLSRGSDAKR
jgi:Tfp pilus assembly protein PilZ